VQYTDRVTPMINHIETMAELFEISSAPLTAQMFGNAGIEHMRKYGEFESYVVASLNVYISANFSGVEGSVLWVGGLTDASFGFA